MQSKESPVKYIPQGILCLGYFIYIYIASCILYLYYIHPAHISVITTFSHDPRKIRQKALINSIKSLSIQVNLPTQVCKHRSERFLA